MIITTGQIIDMWRSGLTSPQIVARTGFTRGKVMGVLNRAGLIGKMAKAERVRRQAEGFRTRPRKPATTNGLLSFGA